MQATPLQAGPRADFGALPESGTARSARQGRPAEFLAVGVAQLHPVTFRCYGAGAQRDPHDQDRVNFTFPVDADKSVRISASRGTAIEFAESLVETLGGWEAVKARHLKRGNRRGKTLSGPAASASAGEKENHWHGHKAPIATPTAAPEVRQ